MASDVSGLEEVPLLESLDDEQRAVVADHLDLEIYHPGQAIVREGESGYSFFIIKSGEAVVTRDGEELRTMSHGDFFGEVAIMGQDGRRTATVTATTDLEAWAMFGTSFRELQVGHGEVAQALEKAVAERRAGA